MLGVRKESPITVYQLKYVGYIPVVNVPCEDLAKDLHRSLKQQNKKGKKESAPVDVHVSTDKVVVVDGTAVQTIYTDEITAIIVVPKEPRVAAVFTRDRQFVRLCHIFKAKRPIDDFINTLEAARLEVGERIEDDKDPSMSDMVRQYARRMTLTHLTHKHSSAAAIAAVAAADGRPSPTNGKPTGTTPSPAAAAAASMPPLPPGMFRVKYVGGALLRSQGTIEEVRRGVLEAARKLLKHGEHVLLSAATLLVSAEGIKAVDLLSSEVLTRAATNEILLATEMPESELKETPPTPDEPVYVAYVRKDQRLKQTVFELFITENNSTAICDTIGNAFVAAKQETARLLSGPFAAISASRDPVSGLLSKRQVQRSDLTPLRVLGAGQFGEVFLACLSVKEKNDTKNKIHTAVKMLRNAATAGDRVSFLHEAEIMAEFDHPNLLRLIGVAVQQRPWLCVLEYM
jgi:hypothetical protein